MITNIEDIGDLKKQSEEYEDLDYLPMSREALDKYISMISFPENCFCRTCCKKFNKKDDGNWSYRGKPIKVMD